MKKCFYCGAGKIAQRIGDGRKRCLKCGETWFDEESKPPPSLEGWLCPASIGDLEWLWERCDAPTELP